MSLKKCPVILGVALLTLTQAAANAQEAEFRFLATGDLPYSKGQDATYSRLLRQSESEDFKFLMHVGDFKAQSVPCSDDEFRKIRDIFQAYPKPVVYTPGDNEWTDCHGVGSDPVERLEKLRELFFRTPKTLRLDQLKWFQKGVRPSPGVSISSRFGHPPKGLTPFCNHLYVLIS